MASLETRNGIYRIIFRFGGEKFSRSLKTRDAKHAASCLNQLNHNLQQHRLGNLEIRPKDDVATVLLSTGKVRQPAKAKKRKPRFGTCLDNYLNAIPTDSIETNSRGTLDIHVRHLKRHIGVRTRLGDITLAKLQTYVNKRSKEKGRRGRNVSAVTIRKELTTLTNENLTSRE